MKYKPISRKKKSVYSNRIGKYKRNYNPSKNKFTVQRSYQRYKKNK